MIQQVEQMGSVKYWTVTFLCEMPLRRACVGGVWSASGVCGTELPAAFAVFVDRFARGPLSLEALPGRPDSGASVRAVAGPAVAPTAAAVFSPHGVRIVRSVAALAGWSATWQPRLGQPVTLAVHRAGTDLGCVGGLRLRVRHVDGRAH